MNVVPDVECEISVNGKLCKLAMDPSTLLLDFLRDKLGLTGAKRGCETGYCGCCTVLLDGKAIHSCSILALRAKEHEVLTIEATGSCIRSSRLFWSSTQPNAAIAARA